MTEESPKKSLNKDHWGNSGTLRFINQAMKKTHQTQKTGKKPICEIIHLAPYPISFQFLIRFLSGSINGEPQVIFL